MDMFTARAESWRSAMTRGQEVASVPRFPGEGNEFFNAPAAAWRESMTRGQVPAASVADDHGAMTHKCEGCSDGAPCGSCGGNISKSGPAYQAFQWGAMQARSAWATGDALAAIGIVSEALRSAPSRDGGPEWLALQQLTKRAMVRSYGEGAETWACPYCSSAPAPWESNLYCGIPTDVFWDPVATLDGGECQMTITQFALPPETSSSIGNNDGRGRSGTGGKPSELQGDGEKSGVPESPMWGHIGAGGGGGDKWGNDHGVTCSGKCSAGGREGECTLFTTGLHEMQVIGSMGIPVVVYFEAYECGCQALADPSGFVGLSRKKAAALWQGQFQLRKKKGCQALAFMPYPGPARRLPPGTPLWGVDPLGLLQADKNQQHMQGLCVGDCGSDGNCTAVGKVGSTESVKTKPVRPGSKKTVTGDERTAVCECRK